MRHFSSWSFNRGPKPMVHSAGVAYKYVIFDSQCAFLNIDLKIGSFYITFGRQRFFFTLRRNGITGSALPYGTNG